jgi:hypothetical protein
VAHWYVVPLSVTTKPELAAEALFSGTDPAKGRDSGACNPEAGACTDVPALVARDDEDELVAVRVTRYPNPAMNRQATRVPIAAGLSRSRRLRLAAREPV